MSEIKLSRRDFLWKSPFVVIGLTNEIPQVIPAIVNGFVKKSIEYLQQCSLLIPPELNKYENTVILGSSSIAAAIELMSGCNATTGEFSEDKTLSDHTHEYIKKDENNKDHKYIIDGWGGKYADDMTGWFDSHPELHDRPDHIVLALGYNDVFDIELKDEGIAKCAKRIARYAQKMKEDHSWAKVDLVYPFPTYSVDENERQIRERALGIFKQTVHDELNPGDVISDAICIKDPIKFVLDKNGKIDPELYKESVKENKRHLIDSAEILFLRFLLE